MFEASDPPLKGSCPPIDIVPMVLKVLPANNFNNVDFPAPFDPTSNVLVFHGSSIVMFASPTLPLLNL